MTEWPDLGGANRMRQVEWLGEVKLPLTFRTNEMAGELGEVAELLMIRWVPGQRFTEQWRSALADEIADGIICADIVALTLGEPLDLATPEGLASRVSNDYRWCAWALEDMGLLCNAAKKMDRTEYAVAGGLSYAEGKPMVMEALNKMVQHLYNLAFNEQIIMEVAVARKFNKTSAKLGLQTLFIPPGHDRALLIP